jgi:hypothetical protein
MKQILTRGTSPPPWWEAVWWQSHPFGREGLCLYSPFLSERVRKNQTLYCGRKGLLATFVAFPQLSLSRSFVSKKNQVEGVKTRSDCYIENMTPHRLGLKKSDSIQQLFEKNK